MAAPMKNEPPAVKSMKEKEELPIDEVKTNIDDHVDQLDGNSPAGGEDVSEVKPLSKNQLKKLKKKEKWNQVKAEKRKAEKERLKARKRACREQGIDIGPSRKALSKNKMSLSSCKIQVAIDCDFDDFMAEKDIKMLVKQIQFSYSANRRTENPLQFHCCSVNGKTKSRMEELGDYKGWDINMHSDNYLDVFGKSSVVYLSSESPNMLETLDEDKVYIIGGLVDHNHHKGLCHSLAEEKGVPHAQLPISEYIDMKTRKVLAVNHVFEILLQYTITKDWQKAFYTVLPPRKGAVLKQEADTEDTSNDSTELPKTEGDKKTVHDLSELKTTTESSKLDNSDQCTKTDVVTDSATSCDVAKNNVVEKTVAENNDSNSEVTICDKNESNCSIKSNCIVEDPIEDITIAANKS